MPMKLLMAAALLTLPTQAIPAQERPAIERFGPDAELEAAARAGGFRIPFSSAVRVGDILYLSGVIGTGPNGKLPDGIEAQTRQTMDNIAGALARAGRGWDDVFKCTVMLDDMAHWPKFNQVYLTYFKPDRLPARSALGADGFALGALVEVECMAYAPAR